MEFKYKTIGVLGGMGAAASANFYQKLVDICQQKFAAKADADFPPILIYSLPLTDFDEKGFMDVDKVKGQLKYGLQKLESAGSDVIVIPCNTVHYLFNEMQSCIKIPIINIIDETVKIILQKGFQKVGILSSSDTKKLELYKTKLLENNIEVIETNNKEQNFLDEVILRVISGKQSIEDDLVLHGIMNGMQYKGAEIIILGCTEIPLALKNDSQNTINTINVLGKIVLEYIFEKAKV